MSLNKQSILGVSISPTSYAGVIEKCRQWIAEGSAGHRYICVTSVHGIMTGFFEPAFRRALNGAAIATPDGMPVVWALRSFGHQGQQRVYGPDLMLDLCRQAAELGHRVYLYGSAPRTLEDLQRSLHARFPRIQIAGAFSPPFRALTPEEDCAIVEEIRATRPDLIFIGLSTPKQERWMSAHVGQLPGVMIGVGAAFDFHAGRVRQAPGWMQRSGLEWLFRLAVEPRRLWKRYLLITPLFLPLWWMDRLGLLRFRTDSPKA